LGFVGLVWFGKWRFGMEDVLLMIPWMVDRKCCIWREYMNFEWQRWIAVYVKIQKLP